MKRTLSIILVVILCIPAFTRCDKEPDFYSVVSLEIPKETDRGYSEEINLIRYDWSGYGVSYKTIEACSLSSDIIEIIASMSKTDEKSEKIADGSLDDYGNAPPVERGTSWVEIGSKIYRLDPEMTEISIVERHLGEGKKLESDSDIARLGDLLHDAWYYHPYDYYSGSYDNSTGKISLDHMYEAESDVEINVKSLSVEKEFNSVNSIKLELISDIDQIVEMRLESAQSDDNLAAGDYKEISLTKNKPEAVELSFGGWEYSYWITVTVDNTRINLRIEP